MRSLAAVATLALVAAPLAAQQTKQQSHEMDPTHRVTGGVSAPGWQARLDDKDQARFTTNDVKFVTMGKGFHVTSGPAAIYYNPRDMARGNYTASATFTQTKAPMHPEAYGLFVGGHDLPDTTQQYLYFIVRGDGKYMVDHRAGRDVHKIIPWTASDAVHKADANGKATNALSVVVGADSVKFLANGTQVAALARSQMHGYDLDGQAGVRVNHNLDVHVADFKVTQNR